MKFYLRMEGVNLANFVYDTHDLSTVRGGSLLLLDAVNEIRSRVTSVPLIPINTGASSGLFQFDAPDDAAAEVVRKQVEAILKAHPRHATFVVDVQRVGPGDQFVNDREALLARNRWRQMCQPTLALPDWNTLAGVKEACEIDRVRPATHPMPAPGGTVEQVSESVLSRRQFGLMQKQQFYEKHTGIPIPRKFAQDLDELTDEHPKRGNLHHKMAVIYVDGNGFGALQNRECATTDRQKHFDDTIKSQRRNLLKNLLQYMDDEEGWISKHGRYRLETLLWGGDEIIWVVPAWQGWNTLTLFYQQSREWKFDDHRLTHAAGMVFCHHNAPIHRIRTLARELAELAKDKSYRQDNQFGYLVLESFDHVGRDLKTFLEKRYQEAPYAFILSGGDMDQAAEAFTRLKLEESLPRRKLHKIVHCLQQKDPQQASILIEEVMKGAGGQEGALNALRSYLRSNNADWLHMAELWDYVGV